MERRGIIVPRYVCKTCRFTASPRKPVFGTVKTRGIQTAANTTRALQRTHPSLTQRNTLANPRRLKSAVGSNESRPARNAAAQESVNVKALEKEWNTLLATDQSVPSEEQCDTYMKKLESTAESLAEAHELDTPDTSLPSNKIDTLTATNALLSLDARVKERTGSRRKAAPAPAHVEEKINLLSLLAEQFLSHPNVFITADSLSRYVRLQALISRPDSIPQIFDLYANKPRPTLEKGTVKHHPARPTWPNAAIPKDAATVALTAALHVRNLPLALSIIITSFQQKAFKRAKSLRRALPPATGAALLPIALWTGATQFAALQTGMDAQQFQTIAFAGFATYLGAVGTIGYVAITSANDQMRRVTWAPGMPLSERWVREEERAAVDRVVCAWGFADKRRWGEEEGEDWAQLREWAGLQGMIVDATTLMEGMQ